MLSEARKDKSKTIQDLVTTFKNLVEKQKQLLAAKKILLNERSTTFTSYVNSLKSKMETDHEGKYRTSHETIYLDIALESSYRLLIQPDDEFAKQLVKKYLKNRDYYSLKTRTYKESKAMIEEAVSMQEQLYNSRREIAELEKDISEDKIKEQLSYLENIGEAVQLEQEESLKALAKSQEWNEEKLTKRDNIIEAQAKEISELQAEIEQLTLNK